MVVYSLEEFGGLEEIATALAVELKKHGHQISVLITAWAPPDNQYLRRLCENEVAIVQLPKWLSHAASDWSTKEKILSTIMRFSAPLTYFLGSGLFLLRRRPWGQSHTSGRNWLRGQLMNRLIGPDRRKPLTRLLLYWWQFRWHPDLLHVQGYTNGLLFAIEWAYANKLPVVYVENQTPDARFDWWRGFEQSINKANVVVAASERSARALRDVCSVTQPIIVFNPNVADPKSFGWHMERPGRNGDQPIFVTTIARLWVTKGLKYLLEAIEQVTTAHPATRFKVYGDGELRQELLAYADELGLDGDSIFVGAFTRREELTRIMAQTDIFVMSSILEGQPLAVVEAMAYGCPIVATSVGGVPELIEDGVNGLLCEPRDSACLADKICTLIEDSALRLRLGQAARRSYEQGPFQPASVSEHFISIYNKVLRQAHPKLTS
jgi:glycosyltransferase involved in cell wall biosynthesis